MGEYLVAHLVKENAEVFIADIYEDRIKAVVKEYGVKAIDAKEVYSHPMDIYSPCALGATVNDDTLSQLTCSIICGAANNQLANESIHGKAVMDKGILYAPDYLVNAGGIINCYWEIIGYSQEAALSQAEKIYTTMQNALVKSASEKIPTYLAANLMAEERIAAIANINKKF